MSFVCLFHNWFIALQRERFGRNDALHVPTLMETRTGIVASPRSIVETQSHVVIKAQIVMDNDTKVYVAAYKVSLSRELSLMF